MSKLTASLAHSIQARFRWTLAGLIVLAAALACSASATNAPLPTSTPLPPLPEVSSIVAASEFVVGEDRFPFGLVSQEGGLLENAEVQVLFYYLKQGSDELRGEAPAPFYEIKGVTPHQHPDGQIHEHAEVRGAYVANGVIFDTPGFWKAEFVARTATGQSVKVQGAAFEVKAESAVPYIGESVPPSRNLTLADVENIEEIETRVPP